MLEARLADHPVRPTLPVLLFNVPTACYFNITNYRDVVTAEVIIIMSNLIGLPFYGGRLTLKFMCIVVKCPFHMRPNMMSEERRQWIRMNVGVIPYPYARQSHLVIQGAHLIRYTLNSVPIMFGIVQSGTELQTCTLESGQTLYHWTMEAQWLKKVICPIYLSLIPGIMFLFCCRSSR